MALLGNCTTGGLPFPTIFGADILTVEATATHNYTFPDVGIDSNSGAVPQTPIHFCNVTVVHTHPGQNDSLRTQIWLPLPSDWNGRLRMGGGGGWAGGYNIGALGTLIAAVSTGYATSTVDAGVSTDGISPEEWALISDGNVDYYSLQNFAYKGIHDGALITKEIIESYYGRPASYSYWSGFSGCGRQGYVFAQRYPEVFDGIAAAAPAVYWPEFFHASGYLAQVVNEIGETPHACELDTFLQAVIAACDGLDGLIDGVISYPDLCSFDPYTLVGSPADCTPPGPSTISRAAAIAVDAMWHGMRTTNGSLLWPTAGYETNVTNNNLLNTTCAGIDNCTAEQNPLFQSLIRYFVAKDADYDVKNMTREEYIRSFRASIRELSSILGTSSPDLTEFRVSGHKLLTWHGLADDLIPYGNTRLYYDSVMRLDPTVHSYYRVFEAPGVAHCSGGVGGKPNGAFEALVAWVENGTVPESLVGTNPQNKTSLLCPYPKKAVFKGKSPEFNVEDFECSYQI